MSLTPEEIQDIRERNDTDIFHATYWDSAPQPVRDVEALLDHIEALSSDG